jgi:hypothetical protein
MKVMFYKQIRFAYKGPIVVVKDAIMFVKQQKNNNNNNNYNLRTN